MPRPTLGGYTFRKAQVWQNTQGLNANREPIQTFGLYISRRIRFMMHDRAMARVAAVQQETSRTVVIRMLKDSKTENIEQDAKLLYRGNWYEITAISTDIPDSDQEIEFDLKVTTKPTGIPD